MLSSVIRQTANPIVRDTNNPPEEFLRAIVDACVSNVAVLDESGSIIYASKAWHLFQQGTVVEAERFEMAPYYFESCRRLTTTEFEEDADISLEDDLQEILF